MKASQADLALLCFFLLSQGIRAELAGAAFAAEKLNVCLFPSCGGSWPATGGGGGGGGGAGPAYPQKAAMGRTNPAALNQAERDSFLRWRRKLVCYVLRPQLSEQFISVNDSRTVLYLYCAPYSLELDYRQNLLEKELAGYNANTICLQEVFVVNLGPAPDAFGLEGPGGPVPD